jgi:hypothetical protein
VPPLVSAPLEDTVCSFRNIGDTCLPAGRLENGVTMRIINAMAPGARRLAGHGAEISRDARARLKWMDYYRSHGYNARLTCRHYGIAPETFYRWKRRYDPSRLVGLEDRAPLMVSV